MCESINQREINWRMSVALIFSKYLITCRTWNINYMDKWLVSNKYIVFFKTLFPFHKLQRLLIKSCSAGKLHPLIPDPPNQSYNYKGRHKLSTEITINFLFAIRHWSISLVASSFIGLCFAPRFAGIFLFISSAFLPRLHPLRHSFFAVFSALTETEAPGHFHSQGCAGEFLASSAHSALCLISHFQSENWFHICNGRGIDMTQKIRKGHLLLQWESSDICQLLPSEVL